MVNTFTQNAKAYWRLWGALGEPMVRGVDAWAEAQRSYLRWLRGASEVGGEYGVASRHGEAEEVAKSSGVTEAERSAKESAREAERIAREAAERNAGEAERIPTEDIRSIVRESVRRSRGEA
jgi:hypothetical protein